MDKFSYLSNADVSAVEELYQKYLEDPSSVEEGWARFFEGFEFARENFEEAVKVNDHAMDCLKYLIHYVEDASEPVKKDYEFDWYEIMRNEETWMSV